LFGLFHEHPFTIVLHESTCIVKDVYMTKKLSPVARLRHRIAKLKARIAHIQAAMTRMDQRNARRRAKLTLLQKKLAA
jgi:prefoldin subunit 5